MISKYFRQIWKIWSDFWFSPVPLLNLAVFRILLTGTLLSLYIARQFDLNLFYSDQGILPKKIAFAVMPEFYRPPWMLAFWPDSLLSTMHLLLLLGLLCLFLGIGNRFLSTLTGLGTVYLNEAFLQRNMSVMFGADQIGGIFLLYLAGSNHSEFLSLRSYLQKQDAKFSELSSDLWTPMFYRLIQVHLCLIYMYTGFEKLKGASWWDGTALWSVFANPQFVITDMTWTRHVPIFIALISFSTILFEIYFPVLVWSQKTKKLMLSMGVLFHTGIAVLMALYSFALVMMSPYFLFISQDSLKSFINRLRMRFFRS